MNVPVQANAEYTILVSMYEVYNDRIFDLLTIPTNTKDLRRRHLLFKSTEASPDRKVVAGLRKVVCGTYDEALMVLETGLHERRVAGTGSNSVSSRSHGFFVVEVKRRVKGGMSSLWSGATMTIVDLAGSERARNAKTAGATLAEAGKINESLMYLGQCLQMQSDQSQENGNKVSRKRSSPQSLTAPCGRRLHSLFFVQPSLVPFRQCKLTELLFSNSFPSSHNHHNYTNQTAIHHHHHHHRNPQKAVMIVTADPIGDFNATSQILRYSALAREVTVPRIPSVSSTILAGIVNTGTDTSQARQRSISGSSGQNEQAQQQITAADSEMVELAFSEIARLNEQVEILTVRLEEESGRRREAEDNWQRAEEQTERIEMDVREECWSEMEQKLSEERRRWVAAWGEETDRNDEHLDRKIDLLSQSQSQSQSRGSGNGGVIVTAAATTTTTTIHEDEEDAAAYTQRVESENDALKAKLASLQREMQCRSPTKKSNVKSSKKEKEVPPPKMSGFGVGSYGDGIDNSFNGDEDGEEEGNTSVLRDSLSNLNAMHISSPGGAAADHRESSSLDWNRDISFADAVDDEEGMMKTTTTTMMTTPLKQQKTRKGDQLAAGMATPGTITTTGKKVRKLTARKWDLMDESEMAGYDV